MLLFGQTCLGLLPARTAGVQTGDWWKLRIEMFGSTTPETNPYYDYMTNADWLTISVLNVSENNVTLLGVLHFKNQTETMTEAWLDVATGQSSSFTSYDIPPCVVLAAKLEEGDAMYTERFPFDYWYISKTFMKTYVEKTFQVNYVHFSLSGYTVVAYFAKDSGIICEAQISTETYTLHALVIEGTADPIIPEFPTNVLLASLIVTLLLSVVVWKAFRNKSANKTILL